MAVVSKYANAHTVITTGYTNPSNAYATGDSAYATAAPGKNAERSAYWGFPAFATGDIPDNSVINSIKVTHFFKVSTTASVATEYIQVFLNTTAQGTEQSNAAEPLTDTELAHTVTSGISLTNLRTANVVRARTRSAQGNSSTAVTFSIDYVKITVDYTPPTSLTLDLDDSATASDDSSSKAIGYDRTLTDSVTANDNNTRESGKEINLSDSVTASDSRSSESAIQRTAADSVTPSDSASRAFGFDRPISDTVTPSDSPTRSYGFARSISDTVTPSDNTVRESGKELNLSDSVTASDNRSFQSGKELSISDSVAASDNRTSQSVIQRSLSDSVTPSDNASRGFGFIRSQADSVTASDSTTRARGIEKSLSDSVTPSESLTTNSGKELSLSDSVTASDSQSREAGLVRSLSDSVTASDQQSSQSVIQRSITDSVTPQDSTSVVHANSMSAKVSALAARIGVEIKSVWSSLNGKEGTITKSTGYLTWNGSAFVWKNETYSLSTHDHGSTYEALITKSTGYLRWTGSAWEFKNESYALSGHTHSGVYLESITKAMVEAVLTGAITSHTHAYIPTTHTVNSIVNGTGFLKNNGAGVWSWDNSTFLTAISKAMVEAVLTGAITSHTHAYEAAISKSTGYLRWTGTAWEFKNETYSLSSHDHAGTYEPVISKATGYLTWNGSAWTWKNEAYSLSTHNHSGTYLESISKAMVEAVLTGAITSHTHAYIPTTHTVNSIVNGTGFLKNNGSGTWSWDNSTFLTAISKAMVEAVLTGAITSHTHSYEPLITKLTGYLRWTGTVWEFKNETYSLSSHNHDSAYEALITKSTGYLKWNGSAWTFVNETYSLSSHTHSGVYEPAFSKNTAFNKNFGTGSGTVCEGNDGRLSDARTPTAHKSTHEAGGSDAISWATVHGYGTTANMPTASSSNVGYLYFDESVYKMYRSNGTSWDEVERPDPTFPAVDYDVLHTDLTQRVAISASNIDWDSGGIYTKTLGANTTFTFSNLKLNKTITLILSGNYTVTLPTYCKRISGTYDGATTNYIQLHCTNATSSSEEVWYTISKQAS